jgi:(1->4)-alpha-D-glucan 1-alpha-D-glucosylmutase
MQRMDSGLPKLWVTHQVLQLRREKPEWFSESAGYAPLHASGPKAGHVVAYLRGKSVITCVSRWNAILAGGWDATAIDLPNGRWKNELTGEEWNGGTVQMESLLQRFPVALLTRQAN